MKTITVRANEVSQPYYAGAGSRITLTGSGYVEWAGVEKLQDALNGATWQTWPAGSTAGYRDTDRGMARHGRRHGRSRRRLRLGDPMPAAGGTDMSASARAHEGGAQPPLGKIGRASCRERV